MNTGSSIGRSREALGLGVGLLMLAAAPFRLHMLHEPGWLLLVIVLLACLGGFLAGGMAARNGTEPAKAVRVGVGAAFITALVAAAANALMARLMEGWLPVFRAGLAGGLSIMPGTFFGMICAGVAALTMTRVSAEGVNLDVEPPSPSPQTLWGLRGLIGLIVALAIFLPPGSPGVRPVQETASIRPEPQRPPPFSFTPSQSISQSNALQWRLANHRVFKGIIETSVVLSRDDRYAACLSRDLQTIHVIDLHTEFTSQVKLEHRVDRFSFSPDANRLFVTSHAGNHIEYGVAQTRGGRFIPLPKPKKGMVPPGVPFWWQEKEVLIISGGSERMILNLDTLEVDAAKDVASWKATNPLIQEKIVREITPSLMDRMSWKWELRPCVVQTELPEVENVQGWPMTLQDSLAISLPEHDSSLVFPQLAVNPGDWFCSSRDGSKVLHASNGMLHQYYFEIDAVPPLVWKIAMPHGPDEGKDSAEMQRALDAGSLAALVYAPMLNPLNQAVVGPDRTTVKAIMRFQAWKGKEATAYLWQRYHPVREGDIIADACSLPDVLKGALFEIKAPYRWWLPLPAAQSASDNITLLPSRTAKKEQLAKIVEAEKAGEDARNAKEEAARKMKAEEEARLVKIVQEQAAAMAAERKTAAEKAAAAAMAANANQVLDEQIRKFVKAHHQKSKEGDVHGLVGDYTTRVDYFKNGVVDRAWVLQDEMKYHTSHIVLDEAVVGDIAIKPAGGGVGHEATYLLRAQTQDLNNNKIGGGMFAVKLIILETSEGLRIGLHHSEKKP
jgi:hypothetical protein